MTACWALVRATTTGFEVVDNTADNSVYDCDRSNVVNLKADYGKGVALADAGKSLADLK